jgi:Ca2+-transporting ATPase
MIGAHTPDARGAEHSEGKVKTVSTKDNPLTIPAYRQSADRIVAELETNASKGLTADQVRTRLARYGPNQLITEKPIPAWRKFLRQFQDTLVILLLIATVISTVVWFYERDSALPYEAIAIFAIVLLNAIMGYVQTSRAEQAIASLRAMSPPEATVVRECERRSIPTSELVPGDLLLVEEGDTVSADARLIQSTALKTAEAGLTGESLPVPKDVAPLAVETQLGDQHNMVFSGTIATYGRGMAVVVATGMQTEMGRIARLLKETPSETTPLQAQLDRTGKLLGLIVIGIAVAMIATIIIAEHVTGFSAVVDVLIFGVALAVAAVPEGLPTIVTVVLSSGVQRMARRNALIRHLAAVETLGSANVIASDKTGTLTKNEMTVRKVVTSSGTVDIGGTGYTPAGAVYGRHGEPLNDRLQMELEWALIIADRANNAVLQHHEGRWTVQGDPTEGALLVVARKAGLDPVRLDSKFARLGEVPFSSERKLMTTIHRETAEPERTFLFSKGAPDVLLSCCSHEVVASDIVPLTEKRRAEILKTTEDLAGEALRTLGLAYRTFPMIASEALPANESIERDLVFAGLVAMIDPPRDETKQAVARAKNAGIRPIMITGDHPRTAEVIAREVGIAKNGRAITGAELEKLSDEELLPIVKSTSLYARVSPEQKLRIVKALQRGGAIVGMTGDGVNDAPALKTADIGIAMGIAGTDVSREVSDMILADDNFASIVTAVEEGRAIFSNIRKFLRYLLSSNIGEVMTMFFGVLLARFIGLTAEENGLALPLVATQILWINLVTDGAPALALGLDPADEDVMDKPPRPRAESAITPRMWWSIVCVGAVMAAGTLLVLDASLPGGLISGSGSMHYAQTMAFTTLVLCQMFNVFNSRSDEQSAFAGLFRNHWLWLAVGVSLVLQVAVIYLPGLQHAFSTVPISFADWLLCAGIASSVLWLCELGKLAVRKPGPAKEFE